MGRLASGGRACQRQGEEKSTKVKNDLGVWRMGSYWAGWEHLPKIEMLCFFEVVVLAMALSVVK